VFNVYVLRTQERSTRVSPFPNQKEIPRHDHSPGAFSSENKTVFHFGTVASTNHSLQRKSAGIKQVEIFNICEFYCSMLKVILLWMTDYTTLVLGRCLALKVS